MSGSASSGFRAVASVAFYTLSTLLDLKVIAKMEKNGLANTPILLKPYAGGLWCLRLWGFIVQLPPKLYTRHSREVLFTAACPGGQSCLTYWQLQVFTGNAFQQFGM